MELCQLWAQLHFSLTYIHCKACINVLCASSLPWPFMHTTRTIRADFTHGIRKSIQWILLFMPWLIVSFLYYTLRFKFIERIPRLTEYLSVGRD